MTYKQAIENILFNDKVNISGSAKNVSAFTEALCVAVYAIRAAENCDQNATGSRLDLNTPLTLDQLRDLEGKPVWVRVIDHTIFGNKEDDFDGWGMCRKSWVRIWDRKREDLVHIDYNFEDYGQTWLAYAYPPVHIDRETWTAEWKDHYRSGASAGTGYVCSACDMWNVRKSDICPSCGKAMTPEAWAMLEKRILKGK